MSENKQYKIELAGQELIIEIRNLAEQANGSVFVRYGGTMVLATAVMSKEDKPDQGFFPLTLEYEERYYAAGKIKGARCIRREGKPSDEAICNARIIDRAIRPLFPENLKKEVQVVITVLSFDSQNDPDILGLLAASLALSLSDIPWQGPLAALRAGGDENQFILNPVYGQRSEGKIDVVFSSLEDKDMLINMIEGRFEQVKELQILKSWQTLKNDLKKLIDLQKEIIRDAGKEKIALEILEPDLELAKKITAFLPVRLE